MLLPPLTVAIAHTCVCEELRGQRPIVTHPDCPLLPGRYGSILCNNFIIYSPKIRLGLFSSLCPLCMARNDLLTTLAGRFFSLYGSS